MNMADLAYAVWKQYSIRCRPTDFEVVSRRLDGDVYWRLRDGRNGIVRVVPATIEIPDERREELRQGLLARWRSA